VIEALTDLCADPKNTVYVVSGDSSDNVVNAVGHIPGLGLAASNGGHFSPPTCPGQTRRTWQMFDLGVDWDAVKRVRGFSLRVCALSFSSFTHLWL
jgi:trehalose 6-phosphate synthase/phosphatase